MEENNSMQLFEDKAIQTAWDEKIEEWYFSVVDVVAVLTDSKDPNAYQRKLKQRLKAEGNENVTNCHSLLELFKRIIVRYLREQCESAGCNLHRSMIY